MRRLIALLFLLLFGAPAGAADDNKQQELDDLRGRIAQLREEVEQASEDRKEAADGLRDSEKRISEVTRLLTDLQRDERRIGSTLTQLGQQRDSVAADLREQERQLAELIRQRYRAGDLDTARLLLSGRDPGAVQRDLGYYAYIGRARADLVERHRASLAELAAIEDKTRQRQQELNSVEQAQRARHQQLNDERQARQGVYDKLSSQIRQQRRQIDSLVRDQQRLTRLIERLRRLAEERKARQAALERERRANKPAGKGERVERVADASLAGYKFSGLRGKLALPTVGEIVAKFGQARSGGGPAWKGLFIKTRSGQPVRAVGNGDVVFSDWLRGFGNLLIIDHGEGYLSLYSNNESLYKQAGDSVRAGDIVAATGNTGGHEDPGLYFELRRQGQPFDPLSWVK
ncbi:peptidase M23 [Parasulfuritortus cantonensis]|uniref:Peptidase M23 n=1 Tax=Parasulfuritortus cantonensis TaxID=2528202 RepID=A0A4R1B5S4_9PROT|nr:peptidoglycan DD-metalloendopeptidase family protein [Parasulfuritortus cantonensis]TCJ12880.1 peptidase M23 [Parasulfuritortus cantonensis]